MLCSRGAFARSGASSRLISFFLTQLQVAQTQQTAVTTQRLPIIGVFSPGRMLTDLAALPALWWLGLKAWQTPREARCSSATAPCSSPLCICQILSISSRPGQSRKNAGIYADTAVENLCHPCFPCKTGKPLKTLFAGVRSTSATSMQHSRVCSALLAHQAMRYFNQGAWEAPAGSRVIASACMITGSCNRFSVSHTCPSGELRCTSRKPGVLDRRNILDRLLNELEGTRVITS